jgi:transcriptional regulator with XRE-family HTH domain
MHQEGAMVTPTGEGSGVRTLRAWRAERLLTLRDLARVVGVGIRTIDRIETGGRLPRLALVQRIAAALAVEPGMVAEFRAAALPPDEAEAARRLERMGYPRRLAQRAGRRHEPPAPAGG